MGIAVPKGEEFEFVIFEGMLGLDGHPLWFQQLVVDGDLYEGYGSWFFYHPSGEFAVAEGDVFVKNSRDEIRYYSLQEFNDIFYVIE